MHTRLLTRPVSLLVGLVLAGSASAAPVTPMTAPTVTAGEPLVMASDTGLGVIRFMNPARHTYVKDIDMRKVAPQECRSVSGGLPCYLLGADHTVSGDHDFVTLAVGSLNSATVQKVAIGAPGKADQTLWRLRQLDFSGVASNGACTAKCGDSGPVPSACRLLLPHELILTAEDTTAQWAEVTFAEMGNSRIVHARLDYKNGNTCGKVLWTLDSHNPEWPPNAAPNGVQSLTMPEGNFMITTLLTQDSTVQAGGGRIMLWEQVGTEFDRVWEFPGDQNGADTYLNAVHNGHIQTDPRDGQRYLVYGHSLGLSDRWNDGAGGSWGIAAVDDPFQLPDYLTDLNVPVGTRPMEFTRELEFLPDGSLLGMDAGSYFPGDSDAGAPELWWFTLDQFPTSDRAANFTPDHLNLNVFPLPQSTISNHLECGMNDLFKVDMLQTNQLGAELRAVSAGGTACPAG